MAVLELKSAMPYPQGNCEHRGGANFEGHMSVGVRLPGPGVPGPEGYDWFTQMLSLTSHLCPSVMMPTAMTSMDQDSDTPTILGATGPILGHLMTAL